MNDTSVAIIIFLAGTVTTLYGWIIKMLWRRTTDNATAISKHIHNCSDRYEKAASAAATVKAQTASIERTLAQHEARQGKAHDELNKKLDRLIDRVTGMQR